VRGRVVWPNEHCIREPGEHTQTWDRLDRSGARTPRGIDFVGLDPGGAMDRKTLALLHP